MKQFWKRAGAFAMATVLSAGFCISGAFAAGTGNVDVTFINVTSKQSEARKCLDVVNDFRTNKDNQWYWNEDNETKTETPDLDNLVYDYDLEKIAEQRALEIAVDFSHTRPNGGSCFDVYTEQGYAFSVCGENIAAGGSPLYETADEVINGGTVGSMDYEGFAETNSDYSGQSHRRNLLDARFTNIGMACVSVNGYQYWVMELASTRSETDTDANPAGEDTTLTGTVEMSADIVSFNGIEEELTMAADSNMVLQVNTNVESSYPVGNILDGQLVMDSWESSDESVAIVNESGMVTALQTGTVTITGTCNAGTAVYTITIGGVEEPVPDDPGSHEHDWTIYYHWDDEEPLMWVAFYCEGCNEFHGWYEATVVRAEDYDEPADCAHGDIEAYAGYFKYTDSEGEEQWFYSIAGYEMTDPLGHTFGDPVFVWDYSDMSAKAVFTCEVCGSEETVICAVESEVISEPDCTHEGEAVYTATAEFEGETYVTTETRAISSLGHDFGATALFHWNTDHTVCTATLTCERCGESEDFNCEVSFFDDAAVATLTVDGIFYTDEIALESGTAEPGTAEPDDASPGSTDEPEQSHEELIEELEDDLAAVEAIDESLYTEESVKALEEAVERAKAVLADENATYEEIAEAIAELESAIEGLEVAEADQDEEGNITFSDGTVDDNEGSAGISVNGTNGSNSTVSNEASGNGASSVSGTSAGSDGGNAASSGSSDGTTTTEGAKTGSLSEWIFGAVALISAAGLVVTVKKKKTAQ